MRIVPKTKTTRTLAEARPRAAVPEKIHEKEENPSYQIGTSFLEAVRQRRIFDLGIVGC